MEIKRISKYSNIAVLKIEDVKSLGDAGCDKVIQVVTDERFIAVEFIPNEFLESYLLENGGRREDLKPTNEETPFDAQPRKTQAQMELETALDTILNNDPMGKYNGCNLRVPFDRGDTDWIEWVLKNMHNKFIRDKVALIKASGYGEN